MKASVLCTLWLALFHSFSGLLDAAMESAFAELLACRWSLDTNGRKCWRGVQLRKTRIPLHPTSTPADALSGCGCQSSSIIDTHGSSPCKLVTSPTRHLEEARNLTFSANAGLRTLQGFTPSCSGLELNPCGGIAALNWH